MLGAVDGRGSAASVTQVQVPMSWPMQRENRNDVDAAEGDAAERGVNARGETAAGLADSQVA